MAFTFDPIFAQDPNNPNTVAKDAAITLFDPADATKAPIAITDPTGSPLPNPITVDAFGMGPAFQHPTLERVGWTGAGFTNYLTSYEGMKNTATEAKEAAQEAANSASSAAAQVVTTAVVDGAGKLILTKASGATVDAGNVIGGKGDKGDPGTPGSNVLPTDTAIKNAITTPGTETATALSATYVPKWQANTAYLAGAKVLSPSGDVVSAKVGFTSGASYSAANWDLSASYAAKSVETSVASAVGLGTRGFPQRTRPVKKVLGYFGAVGHGYTGAFGTVNANDTATPMLGTQSVTMTLGASGSAAFQKDIAAYDMTNKNVRLIFRITGNITSVVVYLSNDSAMTNRAARNFMLSSVLPLGVDQNVELPVSEFVPTGSFNAAAVSTIRILSNSGPAGGTVSVGAVYATDDGIKSLPTGAVIFSADDTNIDHWTYMRPKLAQYGMAATLYPNIDTFVNPSASTFTLAQATYMRDIHGFDFGSHCIDGAHHVDHVGQTEAWLRDHFERIIAANKLYGFRGTSFAWPNTTSDDLAQRIAGDYFKSARGGLGATEIHPPGKPMNVRAYNAGTYTLADLKLAVDRAKNGHGLAHFFIHGLPATKVTPNDLARQDFYDLVDYVAAQGVQTLTMSEFMDLPVLS